MRLSWIFNPAAPGSDPLAVPMDGGEPSFVPVAGLIDGGDEAAAFADALGTTPQDLLKAIVGKGGRNLLVPGEYAGQGRAKRYIWRFARWLFRAVFRFFM